MSEEMNYTKHYEQIEKDYLTEGKYDASNT